MKRKGFASAFYATVSAATAALLLIACGGEAAPGNGSGAGSDAEGRAAAGSAAAQGQNASPTVDLPEEELGGLAPDDVNLALRWTTSRITVESRPDATPVTSIGSVDYAVVSGIDRMTIGFAGEGTLPSHEVASTIEPVSPCAEGSDPIAPEGEGMLRIRISGVAVDEEVAAALPSDGGLGNVFAAHETCRADGVVEWVLDVERATSYRVLHVSNPTRLVVDVRHNLDGTPGSTQ